jgi:cell division protein FtsQ
VTSSFRRCRSGSRRGEVTGVAQPVLSLPRRRPSVLLRVLPSGRALLVGVALVAAAAGLYALGRETSMFAVRTVQVEGAPPALAAQVRAELVSFSGTSLLALNGAQVVNRLENLPTVVSATYDRDFPHTLRVRVVPEVGVAVLRSGAASWLVSARGRIIAAIDPSRFRRVPRIWLPRGFDIEPGSFLSDDAGAAARALRAFGDAGFARSVSWARIHDGALTVGLRSGLEVRLGRPADLLLKIAIVRSILPTLVVPANGGPSYLDVSVPERAVAGSNPQPAG